MRITPIAVRHISRAPTILPPDPSWTVTGHLQDPQLDEVSGVAASQARQGVLWVHNDSGDTARVFAVDETGRLLQEVHVDGASAIDWEDISMGPGRGGAGTDVYVSDTGDNFMWRRESSIYRFPEPAAGDMNAKAERIAVRYPDGRPRNVEATTVDPVTGDIYLISKQKTSGTAEVFRMSQAMADAGGGTTELTGTLPGVEQLVTGADVSRDGSKIAITTYDHVYEWSRARGETIADALQRAPGQVVGGTDSESIAFTPDASTWYAIPEGVGAAVYRRSAPPLR